MTTPPVDAPTRLNEMDKDEWWDVVKNIKPGYTREDYEKDWTDFQEMKKRRQMQ